MPTHVPGQILAGVEPISWIGIPAWLAKGARVKDRASCGVGGVHTLHATVGAARAIPVEEIKGDLVRLPIRYAEIDGERAARVPACGDATTCPWLLQRAWIA